MELISRYTIILIELLLNPNFTLGVDYTNCIDVISGNNPFIYFYPQEHLLLTWFNPSMDK